MSSVPERRRSVRVVDGMLEVHDFAAASPDAAVVLALAGTTGNGLAWGRLADSLGGDVRVLAPDLRGRAGSAVLPSRGLESHVGDLVTVLDDLAVDRVVVVGHSIGAFVAALLAKRHPERVSAAVLVDGGLPFVPKTDEMVETIVAGLAQRLQVRLPSAEAHLDLWREHPGMKAVLADDPNERVMRFLAHDLAEAPDGLIASSYRIDALRADMRDMVHNAELHDAVRSHVVPTTVLWAPRDLNDAAGGMYDDAALDALGLPDDVVRRSVPDTNHYSIVLGSAGAAVIAEALRAAVG